MIVCRNRNCQRHRHKAKLVAGGSEAIGRTGLATHCLLPRDWDAGHRQMVTARISAQGAMPGPWDLPSLSGTAALAAETADASALPRPMPAVDGHFVGGLCQSGPGPEQVFKAMFEKLTGGPAARRSSPTAIPCVRRRSAAVSPAVRCQVQQHHGQIRADCSCRMDPHLQSVTACPRSDARRGSRSV